MCARAALQHIAVVLTPLLKPLSSTNLYPLKKPISQLKTILVIILRASACLIYFFFLFMCLLHDSPFTVGKQYILFAQASGRAMMLGGKACKYQRRPKHSRQGECSTTSFSSDSRSTRTVICPPPPSTAIPCV